MKHIYTRAAVAAQLLAAALAVAPALGAPVRTIRDPSPAPPPTQPAGTLVRRPLVNGIVINPEIARLNQSIQFNAEVPAAPPQMRRFALAVTPPPVQFLNEKLQIRRLPPLQLESHTFMSRMAVNPAVLTAPATAPGAAGDQASGDQAPGARLERVRPELLARMPVTQALAEDKVRAFADQDTGDAHFMPSFAEQLREPVVRQALAPERAMSLARTQFQDLRFIPRDVTELRVSDAITVMGGATSGANGAADAAGAAVNAEPRVMMSIVPATRYADGFPVMGRGSHALVTLDNDGSVIGALRRWRTAAPAEMVATTQTSADAVRADIQRQLRPWLSAPGAHATVDAIKVAYYDGNADSMDPVYEFEATVTGQDAAISPFKLEGFVPIGTPKGRVPDLAGPPTGAGPADAQPPPTSTGVRLNPRMMQQIAPTDGDFTLGEYANQDWRNDGGYVEMSNTFLAGLLAWPFHGPITRTQWYVAHPWEVVGPSSKYYMNAVNVAYTVPHGDWLLNTTLKNCCDTWNVTDIGTHGNPGYGAAAGGVLATWIIMSCEVIPSMYDRQYEKNGTGNPYHAFDAWWPVFQGLHNAIGFRTIMFYPDDALQFGFGFDAAMGGDLNSAWFQEVAANEGGRGTYASQHLIGAPQVHYDRASTIIDARDLGQSIYAVQPQSASTTLWNFWMGN